jgi:hypothetical protein
MHPIDASWGFKNMVTRMWGMISFDVAPERTTAVDVAPEGTTVYHFAPQIMLPQQIVT